MELEELMGWDWAYYSNKLKEKLFDFDPEELRPWFKMEEVLAGLFTIVNKSFGITMKQVFDVPVYHEEVTTWEAHDKMAAISACFILIFSPEIPSAAEHGRAR